MPPVMVLDNRKKTMKIFKCKPWPEKGTLKDKREWLYKHASHKNCLNPHMRKMFTSQENYPAFWYAPEDWICIREYDLKIRFADWIDNA